MIKNGFFVILTLLNVFIIFYRTEFLILQLLEQEQLLRQLQRHKPAPAIH